MGVMKNDAVVVSGWEDTRSGFPVRQRVKDFRDSLPEEWQRLIIGPIPAIVNSYEYYVMLPDGSKEGWTDSDLGDEYRDKFCALFMDTWFHFVHVQWGETDGGQPGKPKVDEFKGWEEDCEHQ